MTRQVMATSPYSVPPTASLDFGYGEALPGGHGLWMVGQARDQQQNSRQENQTGVPGSPLPWQRPAPLQGLRSGRGDTERLHKQNVCVC